MKNITLSVLLSLGLVAGAFAQKPAKTETASIATSAQCGMCKAKIEKEMVFEAGVKSAELDLATNVLTVVYKPKKTNPEALRKAVNKLGYDADEVIGNEEAYKGLPNCCKKESDR